VTEPGDLPSGPVESTPAPRRTPDGLRRGAPSLGAMIRAYPLTFSLIGFNLTVFVVQIVLSSLAGVDLVIGLGAKDNAAIAAGQYWRLISPVFIHAGVAHLFVNMYSLYVIGPAGEQLFGRARFLAFYLLCGFAGAISSLAFNLSPSVGASGAIFGLLGMLGAFWFVHRSTFGPTGNVQLRQIAVVAALNLVIGLTPGIDFWAHLGGFLTGITLGLLFGPRYEARWTETGQMRMLDTQSWRRVRLGVLVALTALIGLAVLAILTLA
jgi:rhomboid protease GluP